MSTDEPRDRPTLILDALSSYLDWKLNKERRAGVDAPDWVANRNRRAAALSKHLENVPLDALSPAHVLAFQKSYAADCNSREFVNEATQQLAAVYTLAEKTGWIDQRPVDFNGLGWREPLSTTEIAQEDEWQRWSHQEKEARRAELMRMRNAALGTRIESRSWSAGSGWKSLEDAREECVRILEGADFAAVDSVAAEAHMTHRFAAIPDDGSTRSRLGGLPEVGQGFEWPINAEGAPLAFLLQLDLDEVFRAVGATPLPPNGRLLFFYDAEEYPVGYEYEERHAWRVVLDTSNNLAERIPPEGLAASSRYESAGLRFYDVPDLLPHNAPAMATLAEDATEQYFELRESLDPIGTVHQLLGQPQLYEWDPNSLREVCQAASNGADFEAELPANLNAGVGDWILLLQLDAEPLNGMDVDWNRLSFWIRQQDLVARNFQSVWMVRQVA